MAIGTLFAAALRAAFGSQFAAEQNKIGAALETAMSPTLIALEARLAAIEGKLGISSGGGGGGTGGSGSGGNTPAPPPPPEQPQPPDGEGPIDGEDDSGRFQ